jgi:ketosteroid isomerase-like protein
MSDAKIIKDYFSGWERKDWSSIEAKLADDFTFTSPNDDDHIDKRRYKEKCWPGAEGIEKIDIRTIIERGDEAFARYHLRMKDGKSFQNTEYFRFANGRIREIEVFFGSPDRG